MDYFFEEHQRLIELLLKSKGIIEEKLHLRIQKFITQLDATIEANVRILDRLKRDVHWIDEETKKLCEMRNLIQGEKEKHDAKE